MDHGGAVAGPALAFLLLEGAGMGLRQVFLWSAVPAVFALACAFLVQERRSETTSAKAPALSSPAPRARLKDFPKNFKIFLAAVLLFTLGNSSDAFLLLMLSRAGLDPGQTALLWALHHLVKMNANWLGGGLSDRLGRSKMLAGGWLVYASVYAGFAFLDSLAALVCLFLAYGLYFGLSEPVERAWVADLAPKDFRGTAYGLYYGVVGFSALPASVLAGFLWQSFGKAAAFGTGACLALAATTLLPLAARQNR
jgi:MFS family permease